MGACLDLSVKPDLKKMGHSLKFMWYWLFATSSTPITDRGPTGKILSPPGGGGASPTAAFLSSSISAVRSREESEESMDPQASFRTLRLE
ncbi:hypothetical protein HID58_091605 [Brassica napus]|uniref:Uncharacterized protein n=1 Tax=Brassica napus TaxID=3708 RepID=A0ABQ7WZA1_BRANA|nr:hypothetical protein HID58_091605 [Brassica napus]